LPFGEELVATGTTDKHRFTSYERDSETGTDYAVNRTNSPSIGRFFQVDKVAGDGSPQRLNRYAYTRNDPINKIDRLGLDDCPPGSRSDGQGGCVTDGDDIDGGTISMGDDFIDPFFGDLQRLLDADGFIDPRNISQQPVRPPAPRPIVVDPSVFLKDDLDKGIQGFLKANPDCKAKFDQKGWNVRGALARATFYDVNAIGRRRASRYFSGAVGNESVEQYFSRTEAANGTPLAITVVPGGPRPGIYTRGGIGAFAYPDDQGISWLIHELLHYASRIASDAELGRQLGAPPPPAGGSWSVSITAYLQNGC
jgi:RHS repeat-associated protein